MFGDDQVETITTTTNEARVAPRTFDELIIRVTTGGPLLVRPGDPDYRTAALHDQAFTLTGPDSEGLYRVALNSGNWVQWALIAGGLLLLIGLVRR